MKESSDHQPEGFAAAVIVAAGQGRRFGAETKILADIGGRPMLAWTLDAVDAAASVRDLIVVTGAHTARAIRQMIDAGSWMKSITLVPGGGRRQDSVLAGVREVSADLEVVLVHDAARPLVPAALFDSCAEAARKGGAAIAAIPVSDTIKRVSDGHIIETVPRDQLWSAQTPQAFRRGPLLAAYSHVQSSNVEFTDEASLLEQLGHAVTIVPGSATNLKVTHAEDLLLVNALIGQRVAPSGSR